MDKRPKRGSEPEDTLSYIGRAGSLAAGFGLIGLGIADAVFDPFPGPETALLTAGVSLVVVGVTGKRKPDDGGGESR